MLPALSVFLLATGLAMPWVTCGDGGDGAIALLQLPGGVFTLLLAAAGMVVVAARARRNYRVGAGIAGAAAYIGLIVYGAVSPDLTQLLNSSGSLDGNLTAVIFTGAGFAVLCLSGIRIKPLPATVQWLFWVACRLASMIAVPAVLTEAILVLLHIDSNGGSLQDALDPLTKPETQVLRPWFFVVVSVVLALLMGGLFVTVGAGPRWFGIACAVTLAAYGAGLSEGSGYLFWSVGTGPALIPMFLATFAFACSVVGRLWTPASPDTTGSTAATIGSTKP